MSLTPEQVRERLKGLGGSDIGAVVGVNPYKSAHDVYNEKLGLVEPFAGNEFTDFGNRLESVILDWYAENTDHSIITPEPGAAPRVHPEHEWMRGLPDGIIECSSGPIGIIEAKTAHWRTADQWGEKGTDQVPSSYFVQCAWYMAIIDVAFCDLVVLLDREFRTYRIQRDREIEAMLIEQGRKFWHEHVCAGIPPEIDGSEGCAARLAAFRAVDGEIESTPEIEERAAKLWRITNEIKKLEADKSLVKNQIADMLGADGKKVKGSFGSAYWTNPKPQNKTNWEAVAKAAGATPDLIDAHTSQVTRKPSFQARFKKGYEG